MEGLGNSCPSKTAGQNAITSAEYNVSFFTTFSSKQVRNSHRLPQPSQKPTNQRELRVVNGFGLAMKKDSILVNVTAHIHHLRYYR
jgi:hypothetical protein